MTKQQNKQQEIDALKKNIVYKQAELDRREELIDQIKNALKLDKFTTHFGSIVPALQDLKKQVEESRESVRFTRETLGSVQKENSRLWYLVRAMSGDETLENERSNFKDDYQSVSPFDKPSF